MYLITFVVVMQLVLVLVFSFVVFLLLFYKLLYQNFCITKEIVKPTINFAIIKNTTKDMPRFNPSQFCPQNILVKKFAKIAAIIKIIISLTNSIFPSIYIYETKNKFLVLQIQLVNFIIHPFITIII